MSTLLLRLAAPLQSWGCDSKFEIRKTENMPTKSGITGMLAAALGWERNKDLSRLNALKFGVRADREGVLLKDFHTAHGKREKDQYVTQRYYLCDAVFLVGIEGGDKDFINTLKNALLKPKFALFLGRRSCPPTLPIVLGVRECPLEEALRTEPLLVGEIFNSVRVQLEVENSENAATKQDLAVSFDSKNRLYSYRKVKEFYVNFSSAFETEHDAMAELEGF